MAPAIRPLFARHHAGQETAMFAFMAVNMVGAIVLALAVAGSARLRARASRFGEALALADAMLMVLMTMPIPTWALLVARTFEGAVHVGAMTILMSHAADLARRRSDRRFVTSAGAAIVFAIAGGSFFGSVLVGLDARAPFWGGATMLALVAVAFRSAPFSLAPRVASPNGKAAKSGIPAFVLTAAFLSRFTVGCLVVSFSLFAHRVHALTDRHIGLLYACLTVSFAVAMYPAGAVAKHRANASLLAGGMAVYAATLGLLGWCGPRFMPPLMMAAGIASSFIFSAVLAYAARGADGERARAMAHVNAAGCLGMLLGPVGGGITSALFRSAADPGRGYRASFLLAAGSLATWLVVYAISRSMPGATRANTTD